MKYLIIKRDALKRDGWTYGDWAQYVAFRDDGTAACVRMSQLPAIFGMLGLALVATMTWLCLDPSIPPGAIIWPRAYAMLAVGFAMVGFSLLFTVTRWKLVKVVGKVTRRLDGSYWRDF